MIDATAWAVENVSASNSAAAVAGRESGGPVPRASLMAPETAGVPNWIMYGDICVDALVWVFEAKAISLCLCYVGGNLASDVSAVSTCFQATSPAHPGSISFASSNQPCLSTARVTRCKSQPSSRI